MAQKRSILSAGLVVAAAIGLAPLAAQPAATEQVFDAAPAVDPMPRARPKDSERWPVLVEARFKIDRIGRVHDVQTLGEAMAEDPFRLAVRDALAGWQFWPALGSCRHVEQEATLRIAFDDDEVRLEHIEYRTTSALRAGGDAELARLYSADPGDPRPHALAARPGFVDAVALKQVGPRYPAAASRKALTGYAFVRLDIGADGLVKKAEASDAWAPEAKVAPAFGAEAVRAMKQWRFQPAMQDGKPIARGACQRFLFNMKLGR